MFKFVVNRLLYTLLVLICVGFVIFTLLYLSPDDPARFKLGNTASARDIEYLNHLWGLDRPYLVQLWDFMFNAFVRLDFGDSWGYSAPIWPELFERMPRTVMINLISLLINAPIGIGLGIFAGIHGGKWQDSSVMMFCMLLVSVPGFWLALMCISLFCVKLGWLPAFGISSWKSYILPILTGAIGGIAMNCRQVRAAIMEVFREDYITTARAKGVPENTVTMKHMLPNALMPIITSFSGAIAHLIGGSAITENIFSIPGVGSYLLSASQSRDYPVVRATSIFMCAFTTLIMLLTDIAYGFIDPRIKAAYASGKRK